MPFRSIACLLLGFAFLPFFGARVARSQISSGFNAGLNSGNNALGSTPTTLGVPNFSQYRKQSAADGVTVDADGNVLPTNPSDQQKVNAAVSSSLIPPLGVIMLAQPALANPQQALDPGSGILIAGVGSLPVGSVPGKSTIVEQPDAVQVLLSGEYVSLPATPATRSHLRDYAKQAVALDFTPDTLSSGAELVSVGAPVQPVVLLMKSLQGLSAQTTLNPLDNAIYAFNSIVAKASPELRSKLSQSSFFLATSQKLRSARAVFSSKP